MKKLLVASFLATAALPALSAESVDISVIGTISSASCTPMAGGGGVVDYGFIKPDSLAESGPTVLDVRSVGFSVICDAPANVALRAYSNREGSTTDITGPESATGSSVANAALVTAGLGQAMPYGQATIEKPTVAGLGVANGKKIGGYLLNLPPSLVSLDGVPATTKFYTFNVPTSSTKWSKESASKNSNNGHSLFSTNMSYYAYSSKDEATAPQSFTELAGTLLVQGYVTDKANLDLSAPVNLDGSSTIELYYF